MSEKYLPPNIAWRPKEQFTVGTGLSKFMSDWLSSISFKSINSLPLKNLPLQKENIWNQSHSPEIFLKYNSVVANLFYFTFIKRKNLESIEDIFRN